MLFTESTRHVELTPVGMSFYKDAKDIVMKSQMAVSRIRQQKSGIRFIELEQDCLVCLMPANHAFAAKESISLDDLSKETIIACNPLNAPLSTAAFQQKLPDWCSAKNILYCDSIEAAHCMVASGIGLSVLPGILSMKSPDFAAVPLAEKIPLSFGAFYFTKNTNLALHKFIRSL